MVTRFLLGDLRTGKRLLTLPVVSGSWEDTLDQAETISATVSVRDPDVQALGLRSAATPAKTFLAAVDGDTVLAAGPIWVRSYDRDAGTLELTAKGMASLFDHRLILPVLAATLDVSEWTVPDPSDDTGNKTMPNPDLESKFTGVSLGTIAKKLVAQAMTWVGGDLPIVLPSDESEDNTDHVKTYEGTDFKPVGEALTDITNLVDGCELNFAPRFTSDKLGVEWVLQTGTVAQPLIFSASEPVWNVTVSGTPVSNLTIDEDASSLGSLGWESGGRATDDTLISRAYDSTLVDAGYPLMELIDSSHTDVVLQATLDGYAETLVTRGKVATDAWSFSVKAHPVDDQGRLAGPQLGGYNVGDYCRLVFGGRGTSYDPFTDSFSDTYGKSDLMPGDPYIPNGVYRHRIVGLKGDETGNTVDVTCSPEVV